MYCVPAEWTGPLAAAVGEVGLLAPVLVELIMKEMVDTPPPAPHRGDSDHEEEDEDTEEGSDRQLTGE